MIPGRSGDIAIIGMSATFAGSHDPETFWRNIVDGKDCITDAPSGWGDAYFDPNSTEVSRIYTKKGGFVDRDACFDPSEFGIMPNTVPSADPDHYIGLKLAKDALVDAGYGSSSCNHENTGIILGRATYPNRGYSTLMQHGQTIDQIMSLLASLHPDLGGDLADRIRKDLVKSLPPLGPEMMPNMVPNVITGRIANRLNLMGPNYLIDAACASSLLAIEAAARELNGGHCMMMIAGGMHLIVSPQHFMLFCQLNGLSRSTLKPFGVGADGTLLGEGIGLFVLKRLEDAERDDDRIYAVLKGGGSSSDGRGVGLLAPRQEGQVLALRRAYESIGCDPSTITMIETHGTGMPLGDQTEIATLRAIYGDRSDQGPKHAIGSVKSMIGHCLPAAGAAGLMKAVLALYNKVLPPTICAEVNPALGIEETSCYINTRLRPWIHGNPRHPRRAAVNAFGFGGVNAHLVLEEHEQPGRMTHARWPAELLVLSAPCRKSLAQEVERLAEMADRRPDLALADVSITLAKRTKGPFRLAIVASDLTHLLKQLRECQKALAADRQVRVSARAGLYYGEPSSAADVGKIAFLFPGEGGQHHDMIADLCLHMPEARNWFDTLDRALANDCAVVPSDVIFPAPTTLSEKDRTRATDLLFSMELASAAVFTASMAVHVALTRLGVPCDMAVGHSTGEGAALVASGLIRHGAMSSVEAGIRKFYVAHKEVAESGVLPRGALLTVGGLDPAVTIDLIDQSAGRLHLALDNCPNQAVVFGAAGEIQAVAEKLKHLGAVCVPLPFDRGYHTALSQGAESIVRNVYDSFQFAAPDFPVYSCVSAAPFPKTAAAVRDLASRQIFSRVRFRETVQRLYDDGARTFIEVGPGGSLTGFVRDTLAGKPCNAMATGIARKSSIAQILNVVAQLFVQDAPVKLDELFAFRHAREIDLSAGADDNSRPSPKITLDIPLLSLPGAIIDAFKERQRASDPGVDQRRAIQAAVSPDASSEIPSASPARATDREPDPLRRFDQRAAAMHAHFDLMSEFLSSQSRIFSLLDSGNESAPNALESGSPIGGAPPERRFQLLEGHILRTEDGIVCERHLTIDNFAFVRDHTIGCPPSSHNANLLALPVIPFSVSMEIAAEAAAMAVDPGMVVTGLSECRAYRWLAFDQGELSIKVTVATERFDEGARAHVRIFELVNDGDHRRQFLAFEGKVRLAAAFSDPPKAVAYDEGAFFDTNYAADMLYGFPDPAQLRYAPMFHGPRFQAVKNIRRWSVDKIEADLVTLPRENFCRSGGDAPAFEIDPVLIDAASHLIAYWAGERFGVDLSSFPFAALDYQQFAPAPKPGAPVLCRVKIEVKTQDGRPTAFEVLNADFNVLQRMPCKDAPRFPDPPKYDFCRLQPSDAIIEADFEFLDEFGQVIATLRGWQDRYFTMPHRFYRCRLWPQTEYFSDPWMQQETEVACRRINNETNSFLDDAWGIWKRVLASLILAEDERQIWYSLPGKGGRRSEWLMGRIACKDAVRQWAEHKYGVKVAPTDIQILPDSLGRPTVLSQILADLGPVPEVSISHSDGRIVAAAGESGQPLGIDLARAGDVRGRAFLRKSLEPSELKLLEKIDGENSGRGELVFWAAKEAACKALGDGLGGDPRKWRVENYAPDVGAVAIRHGSLSYTVNVWAVDEEVFSLCRRVEKIPNAAK